jgi:hypothetical protein
MDKNLFKTKLLCMKKIVHPSQTRTTVEREREREREREFFKQQ